MFRNYYILDGKTASAINGTNDDLAKTLEATPNIIAALNGNIGDITEASMGYMDFAVPLKNKGEVEYIVYVKDSKDEVLDYISHDKKASGNKISVVFVENVGSFEFRTLDVLEITYLSINTGWLGSSANALFKYFFKCSSS